MRIQIISTDDCPHLGPTLAAVERAQAALGLEVPVEQILVRTPAEAATHGMVGSPTIRINDVAVEPAVGDFACRLAPPSADAIERALRHAQACERRSR